MAGRTQATPPSINQTIAPAPALYRRPDLSNRTTTVEYPAGWTDGHSALGHTDMRQ
jgi:hypothetical protein